MIEPLYNSDLKIINIHDLCQDIWKCLKDSNCLDIEGIQALGIVMGEVMYDMHKTHNVSYEILKEKLEEIINNTIEVFETGD